MQKEIKKQIDKCKEEIEVAITINEILDLDKKKERTVISTPGSAPSNRPLKVIIGDNPKLQEAYIKYYKEEMDMIPDTISDYIGKFLRILR